MFGIFSRYFEDVFESTKKISETFYRITYYRKHFKEFLKNSFEAAQKFSGSIQRILKKIETIF